MEARGQITLTNVNDGAAGTDAINVVCTPPAILVNQDINNPSNLDNLSGDTTARTVIAVYKGTTAMTVTAVRITSNFHVSATAGTNYVQLSSIGKASGVYYSSGYVIVTVTYADGGTARTIGNIRVNVYANLLDEWKETIEAGAKTVAANRAVWELDDRGVPQKNTYDYNAVRNAAQSAETWHGQMTAEGGWIDQTNTRISTAEGNISTVKRGIQGSNINLLSGVDDYTSSNKLVHKSSSIDGPVEYSGAVHIFTPVQLIEGCTYTIQCVTDGTISPSHYVTAQNPSDKLCTIWLRMDATLNGGYYNGVVFSSSHEGYQNLGGGRHKWTFVCRKTGEYWFRTNSYSDGTTEVTVNFWNIKLEGGDTATDWTRSASQMTSEIRQTADHISATITDGMQRTGIDISTGKIDVQADDFTVRDESGTELMSASTTGGIKMINTEINGTFSVESSFEYEGDSYTSKARLTNFNYGTGLSLETRNTTTEEPSQIHIGTLMGTDSATAGITMYTTDSTAEYRSDKCEVGGYRFGSEVKTTLDKNGVSMEGIYVGYDEDLQRSQFRFDGSSLRINGDGFEYPYEDSLGGTGHHRMQGKYYIPLTMPNTGTVYLLLYGGIVIGYSTERPQTSDGWTQLPQHLPSEI